MKRKHFKLRRKTTVSQKLPAEYLRKMADFVLYIRQMRNRNNYSLKNIVNCDETAVWLDMPSNTTVDERGAKEINVKTTGHEKTRVTVTLTAKGDGTKLEPYVLLNSK